MKSAHTVKIMCLACFAAMNYQIAGAADSGFYLGAGIGQSRAAIDVERINNSLLGTGYSTTSTTTDEQNTADKLFIGYKFNKNFALEAGHFDLGEFSYTTTTVPAGTLNGKAAFSGWNLDAVGILPVADKLSVFGRLGLQYTESKDNFSGTGAVTVVDSNPGKREPNYKYGVGVQYDVTDSLGLRAEAERYRVNDGVGNRGNVTTYTVGLVFMFGAQKPAPAPLARETIWLYTTVPAEKVKEPTVAAVAVVAPVVVAAVVVPLIVLEDTHFEYDKAVVTPAGQTILDRNIQILKDNPGQNVRIAGYTSAFGSQDYNQKLSERRATAVREYLIKGGIAPNRMSTIGYGEMRPAQYEPIPTNIYSSAAKANMRVLFEVIVK
jgi:OOP family OmpA-OmpF porin